MKRKIRKVAVLGAGVMGSGIAAHLANVGVPCIMLDIVPPFLTDEQKKDETQRNLFAAESLKKTVKARPALFYRKDLADRVEIGNFDDDLHRVGECDLIIEVVKEDLEIKRTLLNKLLPLIKEGTIVASNTSGIAIEKMMEGMPESLRKNFLVMHFFNPVRYMKLLELVVGPETDPEVVELIADFGENILGKGIVYGKDTPNFIANRIGVHAVMAALKYMDELEMTPEEVDAIAGPPMGRPRTAAFRTMDLVGLDTFAAVARNVYNNCPNDEVRDLFNPPAYIDQMLEKGYLGNKTRGGFYKKTKTPEGKKEILAINTKTLEYEPVKKPKFESVKAAKDAGGLDKRLRTLIKGDDKAAVFAWKSLAASFQYSATRLGEIADDIVNIDNGMRWGFNWEMGPFQTWDAVGVKETMDRMEADGFTVPEKVKAVLTKGDGTFYKTVDAVEYYFDFADNTYKPVPKRPTWLTLKTNRQKGRIIKENDSCALHDLDDGIIGIEFTSKMNSIDDGIIGFMSDTLDMLETPEWNGAVLYNEADHFSVGANLMLIAMYAGQKKFDAIEQIIDSFQAVNDRMHRCSKPVIAAPHGMALGGGCEVCLGADRIVACAETYIGLVEVGVGLIPGGGGTKEMLVRWTDLVSPELPETNLLPYMQKAFEMIGMAKVATSAREAENYRILRAGIDQVAVSRDNQLYQAKNLALGMSKGGYEPEFPKMLKATGRDGIALIETGLYTFELSGWITEYDKVIAKKLAYVLAGGDVTPGTLVSEQRILELEKEAFMSLLGEKRTIDRIQYMLRNNKPLRN